MTFLAGMLLTIIPHDGGVVRESVDCIEHNWFYDDCGKLVFSQFIFWDWDAATCCHQIRAWRLVTDKSQIQQRDWQNGGYVLLWYDQQQLRSVRANSFQESWTQWDVELVDRERRPKELRRGLIGERK